jgi:repressor LexA
LKPLTHRQQEVLDYIRDHISGNGYPPTLREISGRFHLSGPRAAVKHLDALERKGHVRRRRGSSRGIEIITRTKISGSAFQGNAIPVLGTVPAGPLDLALQEEENTMILDPSIAPDDTFLLKVKGDSMSGDHILPGDMVLVERPDTVTADDIVVVLIGEEATLKRFKRNGSMITLLPSNPDHQPVVINTDSEEIRIIGKIKAVIRITGK